MRAILIPTSAAEAVANGAQALDARYPGWWRHINLKTLEIGSVTQCVCGQLDSHYKTTGEEEPNWYRFADDLTGDPDRYENYGFRGERGMTFEALRCEWRRVIRARLEADKLPATVNKKEAVLA